MSEISVRDVAVHAGVSVGTVSNALNHPDKVSPATLARIEASIHTLGFVRNDAARQLRLGYSQAIGLIVLDGGNPFFTALSQGAEERASEAGLSVLVGNSAQQADRQQQYLDLFEQQRVRGVLLSPVDSNDAAVARLRQRGIPTILVDAESGDAALPSVSVDDVAGGRLAMEHLLSIGRRRIGVLAGPVSLQQVHDRLEGARQAIASHPAAQLEVIECAGLTVLDGRAAGSAILERAPEDRPDAILAANDLLAVGAMQALVVTGRLRVPDDVAIIGYDDIDFAAATVVPLSSIRQPASALGRTAIELLLEAERGESPRSVRFTPELIVRESTIGSKTSR